VAKDFAVCKAGIADAKDLCTYQAFSRSKSFTGWRPWFPMKIFWS